jgi:hypothetical protein
LLDSVGVQLANTSQPYYYDQTWGYGLRTPISGTMTLDLNTGAGSGTVAPFDFFNGANPWTTTGFSFQAVGDGFGGPGSLVLGNILFDWHIYAGIPVSIVWDAAGLFGALSDGFSITETITGVGAIPASNGIKSGNYPIGATPIATTTWNTTALCTFTTPNQLPSGGGCLTVSPSGGLPLIADTLGGSPMIDGPLYTYNVNLDITSITLYPPVCEYGVCPPPIPIPAAVWLFGSGLLGLGAIATHHRRRIVKHA